jgi:hypothetical protein
MSRIISFDSEGNDITCMKEFDALENPCSACDNEDCPDRETYWDKEEVWSAIWTLSDLRSQYSLFDIKGRIKYHAMSLAIKALREVIGE